MGRQSNRLAKDPLTNCKDERFAALAVSGCFWLLCCCRLSLARDRLTHCKHRYSSATKSAKTRRLDPKTRHYQPSRYAFSDSLSERGAIARALMSEPKLLLLDEPSLGLAPLIIRGIFDIVRRLRETGLTILLVEQMANQALAVADRAYVLETGRITHQGKGSDLLNDPKVRAAYLGAH